MAKIILTQEVSYSVQLAMLSPLRTVTHVTTCCPAASP